MKNVFTPAIQPHMTAHLLYTRASVVKCRFGKVVAKPTIGVQREITPPSVTPKVCGSILMTPALAAAVPESKIWEVMAISRSGVRWYSDERLKAEREMIFRAMLTSYPSTAAGRSKSTQGDMFYDYYNVMWIGTSAKDGISRRRALGIMSIEAWNSLYPKEVDIVLG